MSTAICHSSESSLSRAPRQLAAGLLRRIEVMLHRPDSQPRVPPVFITGPPRSGTTLLYQCFVAHFRVAYFCNLAAEWPDSPAAASWIAHRLRLFGKADFRSDHGTTRGWLGPHEAGPIWNRWFPPDAGPHYTDEAQLSKPVQAEIQSTVASVEAVFRAPFVNKNVKHAVRLKALDEIFPGCVFVVLRRDPLATVRSVYRSHLTHSTNGRWWSVKPRHYERLLDSNLYERASGQIKLLEEDLAHDGARVGAGRFHYVSYEELCARPEVVMRGLQKFLKINGVELQPTRGLPVRFEPSTGPELSSDEAAGIRRALSGWEQRVSSSGIAQDRA